MGRIKLERHAMTGIFLGFTRPKKDSNRSTGKLQLPNGDLVLFSVPNAFRGAITKNSALSVAAVDTKVMGNRSDGVEGKLILTKTVRIVGLSNPKIPENGEKVTISVKDDENHTNTATEDSPKFEQADKLPPEPV